MYVLLLLTTLGADGAESRSGANTEPALRPYHEISRELRAIMRKEATARTNRDRAAAIYELTFLYDQLKRDPRLENSETLTSYKNRLWGRLTKVKKELQREFGRDEEIGESASDVSPDEATAILAESMSLAGYASGGPALLLSQTSHARGGGAIPDYGPGLVALIERTIAPSFWDVAGGPGTIVYYAPLRVLVVRATSEVHRNVGGVLGGLRAAGM
jgi:hypothetical protein